MTLTTVMKTALRRCGLDETSTTFQNNAREYFNIGTKDLSEAKGGGWSWLLKEATISTANGTKTYSLASDVLKPISFRNTTEDSILRIVDRSRVNVRDPDDDETGLPSVVFIFGINSSTGYWDVRLWPTPDSVDTITYWYHAFIGDKTSSDDSTDLAATMPLWAQRSMIYFTAAMYKGELGDIEGEVEDLTIYKNMVGQHMQTDSDVDGDKVVRLARTDNIEISDFDFRVESLASA